MRQWVNKIGRLLRYLYHAFVYDGLSFRAAALAYTTLLGVVPLMIIGFTILSFFPAFQGVGVRIQELVLHNFTTTSAPVVVKYLDNFAQHITLLSIKNIIFLIFIALLMIFEINRAFNAIWRAERHFHFSLSFLVYFIVLMLSPLFLGGVMVLGTFFVKMPFIVHIIEKSYVQRPLFFLLPYVLIFLLFTVFNWVLPSCRVKLVAAAVGGLVTTILFEFAKFLFTWYLRRFPTYQLIYGALASVPIFLAWLYVSWTVILLGAIISRVTAHGIPSQKPS